MRESDRATIAGGIPAIELMRRAGEGIFASYDWQGETAILCGSGNNGGDGYVLALLLVKKGIPCRIFLAEERFSPDGRYYYDQCRSAGIPITLWQEGMNLRGYREIADCLFGTGFRGKPEGNAADMIRAVNNSDAVVISIDIPSGLNGDNGSVSYDENNLPLCIQANLTVSIGNPKYGHYLGNGKDMTGKLVNRDIGIKLVQKGVKVPDNGDFGNVLRHRVHNSHKGTYGYVTILGGCASYGGAVKLANLGYSALRSGCGVVRLAVGESLLPALTPHILESTVFGIPDKEGFMCFSPEKLDEAMASTAAMAVGMGWGKGPDNGKILTYILENYDKRLLIDADGLNTLAALDRSIFRKTKAQIVLTPHPKEFERISGIPMSEIFQSPVENAEKYAKETGVCLLLKGTSTVVTDGEDTWLIPRGCPGMGTAGSGDVLSGILAGLLGYAPANPETVSCGAYIAGLAGEMAQAESNPISMISSDTAKYIPQAVTEMMRAAGTLAETE